MPEIYAQLAGNDSWRGISFGGGEVALSDQVPLEYDQFRYDPANSANVGTDISKITSTNSADLTIDWSVNHPTEGVRGEMLTDATTVYIADSTINSSDGQLFALNRSDGSIKWQIDYAANRLDNGIVLTEDYVVAALPASSLLAGYSRVTGNTQWTTSLINGGAVPIMKKTSDRIIVQGSTGATSTIEIFDHDGNKLDAFVIDSSDGYAVEGDALYRPKINGDVAERIDLTDGSTTWSEAYTVGQNEVYSYDENNVYVPAQTDDVLDALDKTDGSQVWTNQSFSTPIEPTVEWISPALSDTKVINAASLVGEKVMALNKSDGTKAWGNQISSADTNYVTVVDDLVYACNGNGFGILNESDGSVRLNLNTLIGEGIESFTPIDNGIIAISGSNTVYKITE